MLSQTSNIQNQRGVALIMVLGMVAIIAAWASTAAYEDMISLQRISNIQDETRATLASESAVGLVKLYLKEDARLTKTDNLEEDWAIGMPPFPIDEGMITATIEDTNRFYNLNDLVDDNGMINKLHFSQLQSLFTSISLDPSLVNTLADWLDKDDFPYGGLGAEDSAYFDRDYKIKNARLDNWSELKLILGFDRNMLLALHTVANVRPSSNAGNTKVNINTALPKVLMALFPNMDEIDAEIFIEARPYENTNIINSQAWKQAGDIQRLSVISDTFTLRTHASFGRANVREEFLLFRSGQNVQLQWRERLGWQL
ncbi:MAG: type II secretion system minor pseudopilin GspK [Ghiorsea sp.]